MVGLFLFFSLRDVSAKEMLIEQHQLSVASEAERPSVKKLILRL